MDTPPLSTSSRESLDRFFHGLAAGEELDLLVCRLYQTVQQSPLIPSSNETSKTHRQTASKHSTTVVPSKATTRSTRDRAHCAPSNEMGFGAPLIQEDSTSLSSSCKVTALKSNNLLTKVKTSLSTHSSNPTALQECSTCTEETERRHECVVPTLRRDDAEATMRESRLKHDDIPHANSASASKALVRQFRRAVKAVALFSIESTTAREATTRLMYSPATVHCIRTQPEQLCASVLRGQLRVMLSCQVTTDLAYKQIQRTGNAASRGSFCSSSSSSWHHRALRLLDSAHLTAATAPWVTRVCGQAGLWREALHYLDYIPTKRWGETELGAVVRALYAAARQEVQGKKTPCRCPCTGTHDSADSDCCRFNRSNSSIAIRSAKCSAHYYNIARHIVLSRAAREGVCLSSPAIVNDLLGLLSFLAPSPARRQESCLLLDGLLRQDTDLLLSCVPETSQSRNGMIDELSCDTDSWPALVLPESNDSTREREECGNDVTRRGTFSHGSTCVPHDFCAPSSLHCRVVADRRAWSHMLRAVRANAITVHQICRALESDPFHAVHYAQQLIQRDGVRIECDVRASEAYLRVCIRSHRWQEALAVLQRHWETTSSARRLSETANVSVARKQGWNQNAVDALCRRENPLGGRQLHTSAETQTTQYLLTRDDGNVCGKGARAVPHLNTARLFGLLLAVMQDKAGFGVAHDFVLQQQRQLSRHYNTHTLARSYNFMLQHAKKAGDAEYYHERLLALGRCQRTRAKQMKNKCDNETVQGVESIEQDRFIENESYAHLTNLYAREDRWVQALHCFKPLLHDSKRQVLYVPTAQMHDTLQYAMHRAPSPGPSWEYGVFLFEEMCRRHVPLSNVSFRCTIQRCFRQAAPSQAQALLVLAIRAGVHH